MFLVRYNGFNETIGVNTSGAIGLNPEVNFLTPFVAASGVSRMESTCMQLLINFLVQFVDAAIAGDFSDPPFVLTSWTIPSFGVCCIILPL